MDEILSLTPPLAGGLLLGGIFFGGLWWTVNRGLTSRRPLLWVFTSLALRLGIALAGFYFIGQQRWESWLLCLLGFIMARFAVQWLTRLRGRDVAAAPREAEIAS